MRRQLAAALVLVTLAGVGSASARELNIDPVYQETPMWCWAAVGEMIFRYYGVGDINPAGNFQCGIIALLHPVCNQSCLNCVVGAGSLNTMNNMLTQYPRFASRVTQTRTALSTRVSRMHLSLSQVKSEIDSGRPIVAGISPSGYNVSGVSEHVALIVGYDGADLIVNDPFPFGTNAFTGNPYESAGGDEIVQGQFRISFTQFVNRLHWRESIYGIRCAGSDCEESGGGSGDEETSSADDPDDETPAPPPTPSVQYGHSCATPVTRCGPFINQPAQPLGSPCWCGTPYGASAGVVVRP